MDHERLYFLRNGASLLAAAGSAGQLRELLLNLDWMRRKIAEFGYSALDEDLALLDTDRDVHAVRVALRRSAHLLAEPLRPAGALKLTLLSCLPAGGPREAVIAATPPSSLVPRLDSVWTPAGATRPIAHVIVGDTEITALIGFPDGRRLFRGDRRGAAEIFDVELDELIASMPGRGSSVTAAAISANGRRVAVADARGWLRLWTLDETNGLPADYVEVGVHGGVARCEFFPSGQRLATATDDGTVVVWDLSLRTAAAMEAPPETQDGRGVGRLVVAPGEDWIAAQIQGADNGAYVWDLATGRQLHARGDMGILALSPQGQLIVAHGDDVVWWDPRTRRTVDTAGSGWLARGLVDRVRGHVQRTWGKYISHIAVDPAGNWFARVDQVQQTRGGTVSLGATLRVYDRVRRTGHTMQVSGEVGSVVTGPEGAWLAVGTNGGYASGTVHLWRPGGEPRLLGEHGGPVTGGTASGRGDWLATADRHGTIKLWPVGDTATGRENELAQAMTVCRSSGRDWFACVDTDRTVFVVDASSGRVRHELSSRERISFVTQIVSTCVVGPDGQWLATADDDGTIYFWDPVTGTRTAVGVGHRHQVVAAGVAARLLVTASFDGSVLVWSSSGGRPLHRFDLGEGAVRLCRADPAGHWLAIGGTDRVHLLVPGGSGAHEVARMPDPVTAMEVNGSQLLVGDAAGGVHVVDPRDGRARLIHRAPSPVRHLVSSPNQEWTACVAQQGDDSGARIDLLRPEGAAPVAVIEKDVDPVTACRPSPDGRMLATVSGRGTLRIWDARHGRAVTGIRVAGGLYDVCWPRGADSVCAVGGGGVELFRLIM